ncbi:hypothetical protein PV05_00885 [Exophiala xenobiotica]|uniref:Hyphally-regulated cell wall protein N-terminal domain-containing protein n=1 Tax=Exophiala xenobiotica TaxID=348802 RepID=A0A0D2F163_9EURO|nr:uncharacterized protein PV05_00885 [Exophiala xenobiotica]KIW60685.1 hypothetical protein PV05_00885 [Exophiala xenobiotica]
MRCLCSLVTLSTVLSQVEAASRGNRAPPKFIRRSPVGYTNSTTPDWNSTSTTSTTTTTIVPTPLPTISPDTITSWTSSSPAIVTTSLNAGIYTNTSSIPIYTNISTDSPTCAGSVTYFGSVPPTVYLTVTEGFTVTVTASNVSVTEAPTLITPLPACQATIMPLVGSVFPEASYASATFAASYEPGRTGSFAPDIATANPDVTGPPQPPAFSATQVSSAYSSVDYTSTVIVTKKTPVPVVVPSTGPPDVNFQSHSPTPAPPPTPATVAPIPAPSNGGASNNGGNSGGNNAGSNTGGGSNSNNNGGGNASPGGGGNAPSPADSKPSPSTKNAITPFPPLTNTAGAAAGTLIVTTSTQKGIGNIIASIINSPFATPGPTGRPTFTPITTTIDNVRVVVSQSSVIIGTQTVAIPTTSSTTVQANGATFVVRPSVIVAPTGTITISPVQQNNVVTAPPATTTFTTSVGDLTFTIGPTVAIISGTTYRIGQNAPATTITVQGTKVSLGSGGVGLPRTTIAPDSGSGSPFVVYTAEGLTLSVDESEAVISGTTYRIGSNAPQVKTTIASESVSFGPGGIGLKSTTITPTAAPHTTEGSSRSTATSTSVTEASATQSATVDSLATSQPRPFFASIVWQFMGVILGLLVV